MKKKRMSALAVTLLLTVTAIAQVPYQISGVWKEGAGQTIRLAQMGKGDLREPIDSVVVAADCTFSLKGQVDGMRKLELAFAGKQKKLVFADGEPISMNISERTVERKGKKHVVYDAKVKGSRQQMVLANGEELASTSAMVQLGKMLALIDAQKRGEAAIDSVSHELTKIDSAMQASIRNYMDSTRNDYAVTCFFPRYLMKEKSFEEVTSYYDNLTDRVKKSYAGVALKKLMDEMQTVNVGGMAPDIKLTTPEGKELSLYSLRGHIVLLDFWASWCGPCLREMPNVKAIYEKYHAKGLEILGVSLDDKSEKWTAAISKHELNWHHVSSLQGWKCPVAKQFNVTGIPRMYIIDKEGKIIAQDLRGEALAAKMDELFAE